jgi:hypothetical protein
MTEWSFRLILTGIELTDAELDALFEAGCDDATFSRERDGSVHALFDRETDTPEAAVLTAIHDIETQAGVGARVVRVVADEDWLTAAEIAEKLGRTRQSIGQLVRGVRGPGSFPMPVARHTSPNPLWSWAEVEAWFTGYEPTAVTDAEPRIPADLLGELNDHLDLRERYRRFPDAPWRSKLAQALPLVS